MPAWALDNCKYHWVLGSQIVQWIADLLSDFEQSFEQVQSLMFKLHSLINDQCQVILEHSHPHLKHETTRQHSRSDHLDRFVRSQISKRFEHASVSC